MTEREKIIAKVRALLSKTIENGFAPSREQQVTPPPLSSRKGR